MWFKQIQLFQLTESLHFSAEKLTDKLQQLAFHPCLPALPSSMGWCALTDDDASPLVRAIDGYLIFCLQIEEKILPATVIREAMEEKIKEIENKEQRKIRRKEKLSLKDETIMDLLPRAFTKKSRVYAYLDTKNQWLVLGTNNAKKIEHFIAVFKKTVSESIQAIEISKLSAITTRWLQQPHSYPNTFAIEKACVLQDPEEQSRVIRCQQQDLFAQAIQALLKDGCMVKQLALSWQDRVNFVLTDNFLLRSIRYQDEIIAQANEAEAETRQQQFDADFLIMTATLSTLLKELLDLLNPSKQPAQEKTGARLSVVGS